MREYAPIHRFDLKHPRAPLPVRFTSDDLSPYMVGRGYETTGAAFDPYDWCIDIWAAAHRPLLSTYIAHELAHALANVTGKVMVSRTAEHATIRAMECQFGNFLDINGIVPKSFPAGLGSLATHARHVRRNILLRRYGRRGLSKLGSA